jgi:hypothetical protein
VFHCPARCSEVLPVGPIPGPVGAERHHHERLPGWGIRVIGDEITPKDSRGFGALRGLLRRHHHSHGATLDVAPLGEDPAFGSGPLATVIQDLLSISIYFAVSSLLIG